MYIQVCVNPRINSLNRPGYTVKINQIFGVFFFMNKQMVKPEGLSALYKPFGLWPHGLYRADNPSGFTTVYSWKKTQIFVVYLEKYNCGRSFKEVRLYVPYVVLMLIVEISSWSQIPFHFHRDYGRKILLDIQWITFCDGNPRIKIRNQLIQLEEWNQIGPNFFIWHQQFCRKAGASDIDALS